MPAAGPSKTKKEVTFEEFQKILDSTPLFMKETPADDDDNPVLQGLRSLVLDGEGDEVATNFKNHGNELYAQKSYRDAVDAYTSGLNAKPTISELRVSLLNNRAASHLALKNYGSVLKDTGLIIALCIQQGETAPIKALYRAAQALIALERWREAKDVVQRAKQIPGEENKVEWRKLDETIESSQKREAEKRERIRREKLSSSALDQAIKSRGLILVKTSSPPDNPHPVHFDPEALPPAPPLHVSGSSASSGSHEIWLPPPIDTTLIYPVFLLYPSHSQSDFITHFSEETSLSDHLNVMFPSVSPTSNSPASPEWDTKREYVTENLVVYVETAQKRLLKAGKDLTLREVIKKAVKESADGSGKPDGMVMRDGLLSFVVLVKGDQEKQWIDQFKAARDKPA
ncbi:hypothetical protein BD324DRAFT_580799 [Kockovaella imperatae]|uniref:Cns1/TTC4 wheel domain-containing protein n=1 Tax=Kockovaella imperatae TaxID=4999 RepID=A0A1Y1UFN6_9TREE|nr:hypothetical protein BD324DRAFT_580799 [Kockovaella imperatae]ORX36324.1 hypothetical protein BD324DRAFT_580799 [Kockovaella imperatae]